jgi:membrane-bound lytic murein transglycosylase B
LKSTPPKPPLSSPRKRGSSGAARVNRRVFLSGALAVATSARADDGFSSYLQSLWPKAQALHLNRQTFDAALGNLAPDPALLGGGARQSEFERTIKAYIDDAVSNGRATHGRDARAKWAPQLARIERTEGVPGEIILGVWGMETDFGRASAGDKDVIRSLATLAYARKDDNFADEVIAALVMIENGFAPREKLKGSWAGAMGQPQFLPSAYLKYAVAYSGSGSADIWSSVPDSLASIGHFLREQGWKPGLSWGTETIVPSGFDWKSLTGSFASFAGKGFTRADGGPLPSSGDATLYLPAGAGGPAFLLSDNYWIIKQYNNSDSYAMSVALLGERIAGRIPIRAAWPAGFRLLDAPDRIKLQTLLRDRGFYKDKIDGRFGPVARDAIHRFQLSVGLAPADGFASARVLEALRSR